MAETNGADHVLRKHPYVKTMCRCYLGVCVADTMFGMALSRLLILLDMDGAQDLGSYSHDCGIFL